MKRQEYFAQLSIMSAAIAEFDRLREHLHKAGMMNPTKYKSLSDKIRDAQAAKNKLTDMVFRDIPLEVED